jgi:2,4-dienoyl-CoA reductase-like NADH-dependent reductase (Old Yellow Enzyme family)
MSGKDTFPHLFSPLKIGSLTLPTRFAMAPMTTNFANGDGSVSKELEDYLAARAKGGFSLIITENLGINSSGRVMPRMVMAHNDQMLPGLKSLASTVKSAGAKIIGQLSHAGRQTKTATTGLPLVAPSPVPCPLNREMPVELDLGEIAALEQDFADAAKRLEQAGFDGAELHGAHGYLIAEFISNYSNKRTDQYGGSLQNRMRFLLNIIRRIREVTSPNFALIVRISAKEFVKDGLDLPETLDVVRMLEQAGIDAISISVGVYESFNRLSMITGDQEGQWLELAGQVKQHCSIPVFGVGRIKRAEIAEMAIAKGLVDIPLFGRAAIADPELPNKIAKQQVEQIIACTSCNICLGRSGRPESICPVNPAIGREATFNFTRCTQPKTISIVGSSWSALTAAWIASSKGHRVVVYAPNNALGGMQDWRAQAPGLGEFSEATAALAHRARQAGVTFEHNPVKNITSDLIWVVRRYLPHTQASEKFSSALSTYDVLPDLHTRRNETVNLAGLDLVTAEAAATLAQQGCAVTLFSPGRGIAVDGHPGYREATRKLFDQLGVKLIIGQLPDEINAPEVWIVGALEKTPDISADDAQWSAPNPTQRVDAWLADAYEPNMLTTGIYDAVKLSLSL